MFNRSSEVELPCKRCFLQANKTRSSVFESSKPTEDKGKAVASSLDANLVELDPGFTKENLKEQKKEKKDPLNAKPLRPILDGEFKLVLFGDDPIKNFKIGKDLSRTCQNSVGLLLEGESRSVRLERYRHAWDRP